MNVKFAISSNINYYEKTYTPIVSSLLSSGINPNDIYFFIGGNNEYVKLENMEVNCWMVDHNSIDFTGLISVIDLNLQSDYWFLLHDTLYVGKNFYNIIKKKETDVDVVDLSVVYPKNMGAYSQKYINSIKEILLTKYKNTNADLVTANKFKDMNVNTENCFLKRIEFFNHARPTIVNPKIDFYKTGKENRNILYYSDIDLYKIQTSVYIHGGTDNINL